MSEEFSLSEINDRISRESSFVDTLKDAVSETIVGQADLVNRLLIGMLSLIHI